jgi:hypothetical protein
MKHAPWFVAVLASVSSAQATWYVDAAAVEPGTGTLANPYKSIQYAHNQTSTLHSDTILVAPGVYDERLVITKRVTVRSSQGPLATTIKPTTSGVSARLAGGPDLFPYTVLEGFTIHKAGTGNGAAISASSGTFRRCIVLGNGQGIGAWTEYDLAIEHCLITGHERGMVSAYVNFIYGKNNIVVGNSVEDVDLSNVDLTSYSCYGTGQFANSVGLVTSDPLLADLLGHDFHLAAASPCIDAGDPASALDPDGSRADMGPLPYDANFEPFATYCTAKTNSQGCVPAIGASGTPSFTSGAPFTVTCTNELNNKLGLLFYGGAPLNTPYQGGWLCVAAPTRRTPVLSSGGNLGPDDCSGAYAYDLNALIASGVDPDLVPGHEMFLQFWSRDPNASANTNRSDALRCSIAP